MWNKGNRKPSFGESVGKHTKAQMRVSDVHRAVDLGQHFPAPPEPNSQNDTHQRLAIG